MPADTQTYNTQGFNGAYTPVSPDGITTLGGIFTPLLPAGVTEKPKDIIEIEYGASGNTVFDGFFTDEFNSNLIGQRAVQIYDQMRKSDGDVYMLLKAIKLPILSASWYIEPVNKDDPQEVEIADFVREQLLENDNFLFEDYLRETLTFLDFGYKYFEKVFYINNQGQVCLKKIASRLQKAHLKFAMEDGRPGVTQTSQGAVNPTRKDEYGKDLVQYKANLSIPINKLVIFSLDREGDNYEGVSLLRAAYKHYFFKDVLYKIQGIAAERFGAGIPVILLPSGYNAADKANAEELGQNIKTNEKAFVVLPKEWDFKIVCPSGSPEGGNIKDAIEHHSRMIAKVALAQFLSLGSDSTGSFALSKDQSSFFTLGLRYIARLIAQGNNRDLIRELVSINYGERLKYPKLCCAQIGEVDYKELSESLGVLVDKGLFKVTEKDQTWVRETWNLPKMTEEEIEEQKQEEAPEEEQTPEVSGELNLPYVQSQEKPDIKNTRDQIAVEDKTTEDLPQDVQDANAIDIQGSALNGAQVQALLQIIDFILQGRLPIENAKAVIISAFPLLKEENVDKIVEGLQKKFAKKSEVPAEIDTKKKPESKAFAESKKYKGSRPLTFAEQRVDFAAIDRFFDDSESYIMQELKALTTQQKDLFFKKIKASLENQDITTLRDATIKLTNDFVALLKKKVIDGLEFGKKQAAGEIKKKWVATPAYINQIISSQIDDIVDKRNADITLATKDVVRDSIAKGIGITAALYAASEAFDTAASETDDGIATTVVSGAINDGRSIIFDAYAEDMYALQRSEILDDATCPYCISIDGRTLAPNDPFTGLDEVHDNCRGIWVGVLKSDGDLPSLETIPQSLQNKITSIDGVPQSNDFKQLKNPIVKKTSRAYDKMQKGII